MRKYQTCLVIAEPPRPEGNVIALSSARVRAPVPAVVPPPRRETSWRDLVRRLAKKLRKR
jgi:hypothetical protein